MRDCLNAQIRVHNVLVRHHGGVFILGIIRGLVVQHDSRILDLMRLLLQGLGAVVLELVGTSLEHLSFYGRWNVYIVVSESTWLGIIHLLSGVVRVSNDDLRTWFVVLS